MIIYRSTRVINFAQGEMATFSTFIAWSLMNRGLSFWAAFPIVLAIAFAGGVAIERTLIRPVENAPVLTIVIITLGLALLLNGLMSVIWGGADRQFHGPFSTRTIDVGGVPISVQDIGIVAVSIGLVLLLGGFFRFTKLGLALRAAAVNPDSSRLVGVRVSWMLALGWGIAAVLGAVAGMMIAPVVFLDPEHDADDPAVRLRRRGSRRSRLPGGRSRRRDPARRDDHPARPLCRLHRLDAEAACGARADPATPARPARRPLRAGGGATRMKLKISLELVGFLVLVAIVAAVPRFVGDFRARELAIVGMYFIALLGLSILTGHSGQISLGHGAFMAVGGYTTAILSVNGVYGHTLRDLWTIPIAGVVAGLAGLVVGIPALRLSGLYLALITFGIAVSFPQLPKKFDGFFGGTTGKILNLAGVRVRTAHDAEQLDLLPDLGHRPRPSRSRRGCSCAAKLDAR